jgi:membrane protein DedA with SNARE-associated domain
MLAGAAWAAGFLNGPLTYFVVVTGDLVADCLYYTLGRWGRESLITNWGRYLGLTVDRVERLERRFGSHGFKILLLGKLSHGIGGAFLVAAGMAKMPFPRFLLANVAATLPKSLLFLLVGYYFGQAIARTNSVLGFVAIGVVALAVVASVIYMSSRLSKEESI